MAQINLENCPFEITPYDQSRLVKNPQLKNLNYTNQDFWSMKARLIEYIKSEFAESFNDFVESDLALMLIENWAFIADTLSFKIDQIANEIFIDTVTEVDNAFRLSQLVGFKPQPPIGARSFWSATITNILETDLPLQTPLPLEVNTEDGLRSIELFPMDSNNLPMIGDPIIIPAGSTINTRVIGVEGRTIEQAATGTGEINQSVELSQGPVIWNSIRVYVDGQEWAPVDYFTDSQPRKEFRTEYDPNYFAYVMFGNNRTGLIPSNGSQIRVVYRVGGGVSGNIVTGGVEYQRGYLVPGFDFRVPVTFRNYTKGEFGYAGDTIDDIKRKIPQYLRTQNRAVTGSDYETLADQFATEYFGKIGKSKAILRQYGCAANIVDLYVLAAEGDNGLVYASDELKNALDDMLQEKKMITDKLCVKNGTIVYVDCRIDVVLDKFYRKFEDELMVKIERRVGSFFGMPNWDYGKTLKAVDLIKEIADIRELENITITFITDDEENSGEVVTTKFYEIIRPTSTEINFVYE